MSRKLVTAIAALNESHRAQIAAAAQRHGFEALFFDSDAQALPALADAEIIFGQSAALAQNSPRLRWLCTPSAGVNQFLGEGIFASPDAVLTNSSGAYGVTIAEHVIMITLEMLRRQPEYTEIIRRREWVRNLPVRSIKGSRAALDQAFFTVKYPGLDAPLSIWAAALSRRALSYLLPLPPARAVQPRNISWL